MPAKKKTYTAEQLASVLTAVSEKITSGQISPDEMKSLMELGDFAEAKRIAAAKETARLEDITFAWSEVTQSIDQLISAVDGKPPKRRRGY